MIGLARKPDNVKEKEEKEEEEKQGSWLLTQDRLQDGLRVLISEDGLFLGGSVTGIRPPDIYGVVVDGERGSRPRILSTEELLNAVVSPSTPLNQFHFLKKKKLLTMIQVLETRALNIEQLASGTRVCAYWSRKSHCLYPGIVSNTYLATQSTGTLLRPLIVINRAIFFF